MNSSGLLPLQHMADLMISVVLCGDELWQGELLSRCEGELFELLVSFASFHILIWELCEMRLELLWVALPPDAPRSAPPTF